MSFDIFGSGDDLTEKQRCILETYDMNPKLSAAEIAANCDSSESYVKQVLGEHRTGGIL